MTVESTDHDKTLRIVRFFLPRLSRQELAAEIEDEKSRLRRESAARVDTIRSSGEAEAQSISREREDYGDRTSRRISEMRHDAEDRIRQETAELHSQLKKYEEKKSLGTLVLVGGILGIVIGVFMMSSLKSNTPVILSLIGAGALMWGGNNYWEIARSIKSCRRDIESREAVIRDETSRKVQEEENARASRLAEYIARLQERRERMETEIESEESGLQRQLSALDARLDELVKLYGESIAPEDEVIDFCNGRLNELQNLVAPALGLHSDDILDERSAEIWAPSFLQLQSLPDPVLQDASQSEREICEWSDDIISPMRKALPKEDQWQAFRKRVLSMLGLQNARVENQQQSDRQTTQPVGINALRAVQFSAARQMYLAAHYFYQKIVCAEDMVGMFRAYVNVLNRRVPHTFALQILYADIAAIGIETAYNRERFDKSCMTIDQHTHTLTLELTSGSNYRMSGDAGSAGQIKAAGDTEVQRVVSQANQAFRDQITNIRALIRDAKASRK